jgi:predicted lipase
MGSKSKNKGSSFERDIAKKFSEVFGESFVRTAHSGAFIGGSNQARKASLSANQTKSFKGDITPPDDWVNFNIELKNYADSSFHLLMSKSKQLEGWLDQLLEVAEENDLNILIYKITRRGEYIAIPAKYKWKLGNHCRYEYNDTVWLITSLDGFLEANKTLILKAVRK